MTDNAANTQSYSCLLIADFTIDNLARLIDNAPEPPRIRCTSTPFGSVSALLLDPNHECWRSRPDLTVVWTRPEVVSPAYAQRRDFVSVDDTVVLAEVDAFAQQLIAAAPRSRNWLVPSWVLPPQERGYGLLNARSGLGLTDLLNKMNAYLIDRLRKHTNIFILDTQRWVSNAGKFACNPKLWYMGKIAFNNDVFTEAARDIKATMLSLTDGARKLLVVDLDDTLWGGIVGEVGANHLRLGGHDPFGEAFIDFQRRLKALTARGIVLAIVSKNDEAVALEAIRTHPEMVLRPEDFAAYRINWRDKAENIVELAEELNLGLQSVVFIDNSPAERDRVAAALPEVLVPDWPADPMLYVSALQSLTCFDSPTVSTEDASRTRMYTAERERQQLKQSVGSLDDWLRSLNITVTVSQLTDTNRERTLQLLNKTNQMNLSTRRLTADELDQWCQQPGHHLRIVRVEDRFGDAGLTGIVSLSIDGEKAQLVDFILSCRVLGRSVEETMLHVAVQIAREAGAGVLIAQPIPTEKNKPCREFFARCAFDRQTDDSYAWSTDREYPLPDCIQLKTD